MRMDDFGSLICGRQFLCLTIKARMTRMRMDDIGSLRCGRRLLWLACFALASQRGTTCCVIISSSSSSSPLSSLPLPLSLSPFGFATWKNLHLMRCHHISVFFIITIVTFAIVIVIVTISLRNIEPCHHSCSVLYYRH